jgi:tRNA (guanine-N7-)-methyltransferase
MRSADFLWTAESAADWRQPWDAYTMTRYGRKAEREGRVAAYLRFRRISSQG